MVRWHGGHYAGPRHPTHREGTHEQKNTRLDDVKTWSELQLFIIVQLSNNGQYEILKRIQVALDVNLVSSLILYDVDLFQSSEGQVWAVYFVIQSEIICLLVLYLLR